MLPTESPARQGTDSPSFVSNSVAHWVTLFLLFAWDVVLRLQCLACKPFWFDETFSVEIARIGWRDFGRLLWWREANMSLYYLLLRMWLHIGSSEFLIRSLSVLIAAATVPAIYWLARQLYDRRVALLAAALLSVNAYDVRYAQEVRSYSLFLLLATLSSGWLVALVRKPTGRNRIAYVVTSILAAYAHFYALLLLVVHWCVVRWAGTPGSDADHSDAVRRQLRSAWKAIAVAVLPLLIFVAKTGAGPIRWITRPGLRDLITFFEHLSGSANWPLAVIFAVACIAAILPVRNRLWVRQPEWEGWRVQFALVWLLGPVLVTALLSFARPVFLGRYMIFCLPALLLLVAAGLARLRNIWIFSATVAVALLFSLQGVFFVYGHDFDTERDASGAAVQFILDHSQPGDGIVFHIAATRIPYEFFRSVRAGENTASPTYSGRLGPEILFPDNGIGLDYRDFTGKPTAQLLRQAAASHTRVWVMLMNNSRDGDLDPATKMLTAVLPESLPKVSRWQFPKVEVRVYSK